jgi:hypothetical protein
MSDQHSRDDGTQTGAGEQIRPKEGGKDRAPGSLGSGRAGGRPTEDDLAKRADRNGVSGKGGGT